MCVVADETSILVFRNMRCFLMFATAVFVLFLQKRVDKCKCCETGPTVFRLIRED